MRINKLSEQCIQDLNKLVGTRIYSIYIEKCPRMQKGDAVTLEVEGMISLVFIDQGKYYKWRFKYCAVENGCLYHEFYGWEKEKKRKRTLSRLERIKRRMEEVPIVKKEKSEPQKVDYDKSTFEDYDKYGLWLRLNTQKKNWVRSKDESIVKSIKVYNTYGFLALIVIETETGRQIVFSENDRVEGGEFYLDQIELLKHKLSRVEDDPGDSYGKKIYQLKYHFQKDKPKREYNTTFTKKVINENIALNSSLLNSQEWLQKITDAANTLTDALKNRKKIFFLGNERSKIGTQYLANEFRIRFCNDHNSSDVVILNTDTTQFKEKYPTCNFNEIFSQQLKTKGERGDVLLIAYSNHYPPNVVRALEETNKLGIISIVMMGFHKTNRHSIKVNHVLSLPSMNKSLIQDTHMMLGQIIFNIIEKNKLEFSE